MKDYLLFHERLPVDNVGNTDFGRYAPIKGLINNHSAVRAAENKFVGFVLF